MFAERQVPAVEQNKIKVYLFVFWNIYLIDQLQVCNFEKKYNTWLEIVLRNGKKEAKEKLCRS